MALSSTGWPEVGSRACVCVHLSLALSFALSLSLCVCVFVQCVYVYVYVNGYVLYSSPLPRLPPLPLVCRKHSYGKGNHLRGPCKLTQEQMMLENGKLQGNGGSWTAPQPVMLTTCVDKCKQAVRTRNSAQAPHPLSRRSRLPTT